MSGWLKALLLRAFIELLRELLERLGGNPGKSDGSD